MVHCLCHCQGQQCVSAREVHVLALTQMELTSFKAAYMVMSFGFVAKTVSITHQCFGYQRTVLAQQSNLFPALCTSKRARVGHEVGREHH